jgi:hypothetical protein
MIFTFFICSAQTLDGERHEFVLKDGSKILGKITAQTDRTITVASGVNKYHLAKKDIIKRDGTYIVPEIGSHYSQPYFNFSVGSHLSFGDNVDYVFGLSYMFRNDERNSFGIGIGYETYWSSHPEVSGRVVGDFIPVTVQWEHRFVGHDRNSFYTRLKIGYGLALNQILASNADLSGGLYGQLTLGRQLWTNGTYGIGIEGTLSYQDSYGTGISRNENTEIDFQKQFINPGISLNFSF